MDDDSAILVSQLLAEDISNITASRKGKQKDTEPDSAVYSWQIFLDEVSRYGQVHEDQKMALSIASAVAKDGGAITEALRLENQSSEDRELARTLDDSPSAKSASVASCTPQVNNVYDDFETGHLAKLFATYVSVEHGTEFLLSETQSNGHEGSSSSGKHQDAKGPPTFSCEACLLDMPFFDVARAPCGHDYCRECLNSLFSASMTDESLFPPRCCNKAIPMSSAKMFLDHTTAVSFTARERELSTPNRVYCSQPRCSTWIPPELIENGVARCEKCAESTCSICKSTSHDGDCPKDPCIQQTIDLARETGWQRCYQCQRFVELAYGCHHITCLCGAHFCYVCGVQWKQCRCEYGDENHILPPNADNGPNGQQDIADLAIGQQNHACRHIEWTRVNGSYQCEECDERFNRFIFQCDECGIMACWRCHNDRL